MDDERIEQLLLNRLMIDCPSIVLSQQSTNSKVKEYTGPGIITQDDKAFLFKLFPRETPELTELFSTFLNTDPGEILPDTEYFHLSATDLNGNIWETDRVRLHFNANMSKGSYLAYGHCRQLKCETKFPFPKKKNDLHILFPGKIDIPCNTPTLTIQRICGEDRKKSSIVNLAMVKAAGFEFEFERSDRWLSVRALSDSSITWPNIMRILEALQFVLARPLYWCMMEINHGGILETLIRSTSHDKYREQPFRYPPVSLDASVNAAWDLFKVYLEHYIGYCMETWHPTFSSIYRVLQANSSPLSTEATTLSIAVEGVLKHEFKSVGKPSKHWNAIIDQTKDVLSHASINPHVKTRLYSALGQMKAPRAKDRLYALSKDGIICERHVTAWKELRNSTAHAGDLEEDKLQDFLNKLHATYVLLYQLVFLAVGYIGIYTDYSNKFIEAEFV